MKTLNAFLLTLSFLLFTTVAVAQTKTEKIAVSGECGMCKTTIEKAAKAAGASYAAWDVDSKVLTVKYKNKATGAAKIKQAVAAAGYDTQSVKASDEAYQNLHACCQYDRSAGSAKSTTSCCDHAKCKEAACHKNGKCAEDMSCCKESGCSAKDCCKKA